MQTTLGAAPPFGQMAKEFGDHGERKTSEAEATAWLLKTGPSRSGLAGPCGQTVPCGGLFYRKTNKGEELFPLNNLCVNCVKSSSNQSITEAGGHFLDEHLILHSSSAS